MEAAARVVESQGAAHLTIDAVAQAAGISKGGLLYHFPNKHALLRGMLEHLLSAIRRRGSQADALGPVSARADAETQVRPRERALSLALLAAAAEDPELLHPARDMLAATLHEARSAADPVGALVVFLAVEGLRFLEVLNLLPIDAAERSQIVERIVELAVAADGASR